MDSLRKLFNAPTFVQLVLLPGEFFPVIPEQSSLELQGFDLAVLPAQKIKKLVRRRYHGVDRRRGIPSLQQAVPPGGSTLSTDLLPVQPDNNGPRIPQVFFDSSRANASGASPVVIRSSIFDPPLGNVFLILPNQVNFTRPVPKALWHTVRKLY